MIGLPPGARDCLQVVRRARRAANARLERPARKAIKVKIVKTKRPLELRDIRVGVACASQKYARGGLPAPPDQLAKWNRTISNIACTARK